MTRCETKRKRERKNKRIPFVWIPQKTTKRDDQPTEKIEWNDSINMIRTGGQRPSPTPAALTIAISSLKSVYTIVGNPVVLFHSVNRVSSRTFGAGIHMLKGHRRPLAKDQQGKMDASASDEESILAQTQYKKKKKNTTAEPLLQLGRELRSSLSRLGNSSEQDSVIQEEYYALWTEGFLRSRQLVDRQHPTWPVFTF